MYEQGILKVEICFLRPSDFSKAARLEKRIVDRVEVEGGDFRVVLLLLSLQFCYFNFNPEASSIDLLTHRRSITQVPPVFRPSTPSSDSSKWLIT